MEPSIIDIEQIESWEEIPYETTHDLTVEGNHNYYLATNSNPILVHNSGKSEFLNFLSTLWVKRTGGKVAMYSPESYPAYELVISLWQAYYGERFDSRVEGFEDKIEQLSEHYTIIEMEDIPMSHEILNVYAQLANDGHGFFITDPFNYLADLSGGTNISTNLNVALSRMKQFAVDHNVINTIIEHPKSPQIKDGNIPQASPWMLYGGSMWWNKMDVIVSVERDLGNSEDHSVLIKTWKVKLQRVLGTPGEADIEWDYGTYKEKKLAWDR